MSLDRKRIGPDEILLLYQRRLNFSLFFQPTCALNCRYCHGFAVRLQVGFQEEIAGRWFVVFTKLANLKKKFRSVKDLGPNLHLTSEKSKNGNQGSKTMREKIGQFAMMYGFFLLGLIAVNLLA